MIPELSGISVLHEDYYGICTGKNFTRIADRIAHFVFIIDIFYQSHSSPWTATISALPLTGFTCCRHVLGFYCIRVPTCMVNLLRYLSN